MLIVCTSSPPSDNIWAMLIVWRIRGRLSELFCAVLCNTVVHNHMHTDMNSSYRWTALGLGSQECFCVFTSASLFVIGLVFLRFVYFLLIVVWLSVPVQSTGKTRLWNEPYSLLSGICCMLIINWTVTSQNSICSAEQLNGALNREEKFSCRQALGRLWYDG